jgi:flagellar basal-body rod modification protein FlgD
MPTSDPVSSAAGQPAQQTAPQNPSATLGKDAFLKLLVAQLQHQDPLNPVDNAQYIAQLAQFSTLEQMTNVGDSMARLTFSSQVTQALSLVGKSITFERKDGTTGEGAVTSVSFQDGKKILLSVGTEQVSPDSIRSVGA